MGYYCIAFFSCSAFLLILQSQTIENFITFDLMLLVDNCRARFFCLLQGYCILFFFFSPLTEFINRSFADEGLLIDRIPE